MSKEDEKIPPPNDPITFSHGFGGIVVISLATFSPTASAGSFVIGPCGKHYT